METEALKGREGSKSLSASETGIGAVGLVSVPRVRAVWGRELERKSIAMMMKKFIVIVIFGTCTGELVRV